MSKVINTEHRYIIKDPRIQGGEPIIKGTRFPVRSVVFYVIKEGMLPEELCEEFSQLNLSVVYEALSYYYDHKKEIEQLIAKNKEELWQKKKS